MVIYIMTYVLPGTFNITKTPTPPHIYLLLDHIVVHSVTSLIECEILSDLKLQD